MKVIASIVVTLALLVPAGVAAETMSFLGTGGDVSGSVYIYPYYFDVNGKPQTLMCLSYQNEITQGETWSANVLPASASLLFKEAAYMDSLLGGSTPTDDIQWAAWQLFDHGLQAPNGVNTSGVLNAAGTYVTAHPNSSLYSEYDVYIPVDGTQSQGGLPQTFIGRAPSVPEPSSLSLLAIGFMLVAAWVRKARPVIPASLIVEASSLK